VLTNFFRAMPGELEEAALVDGATPLQSLRQILLSLAIPGIVTTGLLAFIEAWSEFLSLSRRVVRCLSWGGGPGHPTSVAGR
jgi:ABC-type glycerol-3-phosphate transport system permease component